MSTSATDDLEVTAAQRAEAQGLAKAIRALGVFPTRHPNLGIDVKPPLPGRQREKALFSFEDGALLFSPPRKVWEPDARGMMPSKQREYYDTAHVGLKSPLGTLATKCMLENRALLITYVLSEALWANRNPDKGALKGVRAFLTDDDRSLISANVKDDRSADIVGRRLLNEGAPESFADIGRDLDLSAARVSQIATRALQELRFSGGLTPDGPADGGLSI